MGEGARVGVYRGRSSEREVPMSSGAALRLLQTSALKTYPVEVSSRGEIRLYLEDR